MKRRSTFLFFPFTGHYCRVRRGRVIRRQAIWLLVLLGFTTVHAHAQFFSQQSQQHKLMAAQIVAIQFYAGALHSGYNIAKKGLSTADELKGGTFDLNMAYFNSLQQVSPVVQQNPKGKAIADLYQQLNKQFTDELAWQQQQKQLTVAEMANLQSVADNLKKLSSADITELTEVLTPGKLQLTDQQRLDRLDKLYAAMKDKAAFTASFTGKCRQLALTRQRVQADKAALRKLYGIQ